MGSVQFKMLIIDVHSCIHGNSKLARYIGRHAGIIGINYLSIKVIIIANEDYEPVSVDLTFDQDTNRVCTDVTIVDDERHERTENLK